MMDGCGSGHRLPSSCGALSKVFNGTKTVDVQDSQFASGPLALQNGSGVVKFRKVEIGAL
jgi:hypothetical protein